MTASQQLLLGEGPVAAAGAYQIQRSLRFNSADSAYLNRTPASAGNQTTWTWSGWVKRAAIGSGSTQNLMHAETATTTYTVMQFSGDNLIFDVRNGGAVVGNKYTTAVYRDVSSWYHIVFVWDTTNATAADRIRVYVNGVRVTAFSTSNDPASSATSHGINGTVQHRLGAGVSFANYLNAYLTEVNFIDGQALTPSSFGETDPVTGVWKPKKYTGTYGTNGFYLNFSDNSGTTSTTLGKDYSGNGNNWTPNNFSVTAGAGNDSVVDTPTQYGTDTGAGGEVRGNYCTLNPLDKGNGVTLANGNLDYSVSNGAVDSVRATIGISSGKWYWEGQKTSTDQEIFGIANASASTGTYLGGDANGWGFGTSGNKYNNNTATSYGSSCSTTDIVGVAFDADNGTLTFYKNGVSLGTAFSGLTTGVIYFPAAGSNNSAGIVNFGQRPFAYTAPSGFSALCTQNLPDPTIADGGDYFNTLLYNGNGNTGQTVTGVGFQPDFVWLKNRNQAGGYYHCLFDAVRGAGYRLKSNSTDAEANATAIFSAFTSDGFTFPAGQGNTIENDSAGTYVAWNWKANGAGVTNTAGTITSTVSANTTAGFSIVTWTNAGNGDATVGHGLGVAPKFIITKKRSTTNDWYTYTTIIDGSYDYLSLNTTNSKADSVKAAPTSTVFTTDMGDTSTAVAYCFAPVAGYSAFGSYTGNGSADGPFVYTGFRPRFLLVKSATTAQHWIIDDTTRNPYNITNLELYPSLSNAESSDPSYDLLSNGFKLRITSANKNASGVTYIYAAFAENAFKVSLGR